MEREDRVYTSTSSVYWVLDADGNRRLFHDSLAAQLMEERWARERREREANTSEQR
jgi:hypothetical protein